MSKTLDQLIQQELDRYLRDDISLAEFEAWLVPETWDISPQADAAAHDLATAVTLRIAEFTSGDWTEAELRDALVQIKPTITPSGTSGKDQTDTLRSVILNAQQDQGSSSVVGKRPAGAFG
jgi:hypothetical protein